MAARDDARRGSAEPERAVRHQLTFQESAGRIRVEPDAMHRLLDFVLTVVACLALLAIGQPASAQSTSDVQRGKSLFGDLCVTCHGFEGTGGAGPPLNRPKLLNAPDDA